MKNALVAITLLLLVGCAMDKKFAQIQAGMTKQQVITMLGKPDGYKLENDGEVLRYTGNHYVKLRNGRVTEYGEE